MTGYTDASFSDRQGGAWAVWLRSARGRVVRRGRYPAYVRDSNAAELAAIYAAVYLACRSWPDVVRGVLVRSDCHGALALAEPDAPLARSTALRRLQEKLRATLREHDVALHCTWVKGHQHRKAGTAAYLNNVCDALAKDTRRVLPPRSKEPAPPRASRSVQR